MTPVVRALVVATTCFVATDVHAATQRFALLVAAHEGGADLETLRYAARDVDRMRDVLVEMGGFERAKMIEIVDGEADIVMSTLDEVERNVQAARSKGDEVVFLFYYSGHAANGVLRLGATQLDMMGLKHKLEASSADVRLAFIDSCGAGQLTREKGGSLAPPFVVAVDDALSARGQVIITSSSSDEVSQESDDIQGSFFTHYLSTGMRGDADRNSDGKVTLDEAYGYAYGRTVAATAMTRAGAQHPTYEYQLRGAGDVTLTEPSAAEVTVTLPADLGAGKYFVVDLERQLFVAEIEKAPGGTSKVALPRGTYAIKKRESDHVLIARVAAREKGAYTIDKGMMEQVAFQDDYAKGTPILQSVIDKDGAMSWSLAVGMGGQYVFDDPAKGVLFPAVPFVTLEGRLHNALRKDLMASVDVAFGTIPTERVLVVKPGTTVALPIQYTEAQLGTSLLYEHSFGPLLLAGGGRIAALISHARFTGAEPPDDQLFFTFSPGLVGLAGWSFTDWMHAEAMVRAQYVPYNVDELRSLGAVEGIVSAWVDF